MGVEHTAALGIDQKIYAWGNNLAGQLGDFTTTAKSTPVAVLNSVEKFKDVTAGYYNTWGIDLVGDLWGCGANDLGQIGNNTNVNVSVPVLIIAGQNIVQVEANSTGTIALTEDGRVYVWGTTLS